MQTTALTRFQVEAFVVVSKQSTVQQLLVRITMSILCLYFSWLLEMQKAEEILLSLVIEYRSVL